MRRHPHWPRYEDGYSLIELMIVLVVLTVGILAIARLFPVASREEVRDRLRTMASYHAQESIEHLKALSWADPQMAPGRHPMGIGFENVGTNNRFQRYYRVSQMPNPMSTMLRVDVSVLYGTIDGPDSAVASIYVER